jgi:Lar family restriction alleviation protein
MSEELKPCPFCGGTAKAQKSKLIIGAYEVKCRNGHINGHIWENKADAIAAWNRRADGDEL